MTAYQKLEEIFNRISHLQHLQSISMWDEAVIMPNGGGEARANALATLNILIHENKTQPQIADLVEQAKQQSLTDSWQQANLAWIEKQFHHATCLPTQLVGEMTKASITCEQAWRVMRAANNWQEFAPLLKHSLSLIREAAQIKADIFKKSPYDILIDEYSPNLNQSIIDPIFATLKNNLPALMQSIIEKQKTETFVPISGNFPIEKQRNLSIQLMNAIGFNFEQGRLDVSHHPFCGGVPTDVRITTRYHENEFISSAMAICHETGHACYEQGLPKKWLTQPVGQALGMSVHESQSLLMEMQACRSEQFMHFLASQITEVFGLDEAYTPQNLFRLYTRVTPSLIRVDADEVTYPFHVILRYELEKELIAGTLGVTDLPDAWNEKMQQYLGIDTKNNYKDGVMQDVHWPSGAFGYFPAYTLGSMIAAQLFATVKKSLPTLMQDIKAGHFYNLTTWLSKNIYSRASSVNTEQLLIDATGEGLNPQYFLEHIKQRYLRLF